MKYYYGDLSQFYILFLICDSHFYMEKEVYFSFKSQTVSIVFVTVTLLGIREGAQIFKLFCNLKDLIQCNWLQQYILVSF